MSIISARPVAFACALLIQATLSTSVFSAELNEPLRPLQAVKSLQLDERKVKLGAALFNDPRLSKDNTLACVSCHNLAQGGTDGKRYSSGVNGQITEVNTPTVFNSGNNNYQFWDGRAKSLEEQVIDHISAPTIFASNSAELTGKLAKDKNLSDSFRAIYPDGISAAHISEVIATYQRSLLTPSRFDRYLQGDSKAITPEELSGYKKFKDFGCVACHQGSNVGGNMFQQLGVMRDYFSERGSSSKADWGRFNVTQKEADKHVFKVPSLRNVALTAPYFHDGTAPTLTDAVNAMFKYQLGRRASDADKALIITFLNSLTGETLAPK